MKRRGFVCLPYVERKGSSSNRSLQKLNPNVELQVDCKFAQNVFFKYIFRFGFLDVYTHCFLAGGGNCE